MVALKGTKQTGETRNIVISRLAGATTNLGENFFNQADFNVEDKFANGQDPTDRLTKLIGIFQRFDVRASAQHATQTAQAEIHAKVTAHSAKQYPPRRFVPLHCS